MYASRDGKMTVLLMRVTAHGILEQELSHSPKIVRNAEMMNLRLK